MSQQVDRHDITEQLYVYKQDNSKRWYARFVISGKWISKATKETDKDKAIVKATQISSQYEYAALHNIPIQSKRFKHVAKLAIERMEDDLEEGSGKSIYWDYISVLRKYHIPYYDNTYITSIDHLALADFGKWRVEQAGKQHKSSTLLTHNAAMNRVFDEAEIRGWITTSQRPTLTTKGGLRAESKGAFTKEEIQGILSNTFWFSCARKQITHQIQELLYDYIVVAIHTGMRPGTEMEHLTWQDIKKTNLEGTDYYVISVRKGKTTNYTRTRAVVASNEVKSALDRLRKRNKPSKQAESVFVLPNGRATKELSRTFTRYLKEHDLDTCPDGNRTLYSLRHSYITWQLEAGVEPAIVSSQCGTSIEMLSRFYSHVKSPAHAKKLAGNTDLSFFSLLPSE